MNGDEEKLDRLLSAPLAPLVDNGFSASVMAKMAAADTHQPWSETAILAVAACVLVGALSMTGFSDWIARVGVTLATSSPLAIAGFALAITWSYMRVLAD